MSTVAMKPKTGAPLGNRILAVLAGCGQRRMLLRPLIKNRQPKMIRRTVSAIDTRDVGSKVFLLSVRQTNDANYSESVACRQSPPCSHQESTTGQICQPNSRNLIVSALKIIYNAALMNSQFHGMQVARYCSQLR